MDYRNAIIEAAGLLDPAEWQANPEYLRGIGAWGCRGGRPMSRYGYNDWTLLESPDAIRVQVGRMTLAFPPGTSKAEIAKRVKAVETAPRRSAAAEAAKWKLPKPTRVKAPSVDMMHAAGTTVPEHGYMDRHSAKVQKYTAPGKPLAVLPVEMLRAGLLAQAERTLKKWPAENPPEHAAWMAKVEGGELAKLSTEHLEKVVASILRPGGRVASGKFAASLVYGLAELDRRKAQAA